MNVIKTKIKMLTISRGLTLKKLAEKLGEITGEEYTYNSLLGKLNRESLSLKETYLISQILDYRLEFIDNKWFFRNMFTHFMFYANMFLKKISGEFNYGKYE